LPVDLVAERVRPEREPDCSAGCGRGGYRRRREEPAAAEGDDRRRALGARSVEDPLAKLLGRLRPLRRVSQLGCSVSQPGYLLAAALARVEVSLVRPAILRVEGIEGVRRREVVEFVQRSCLRA
jgi:hypothetical protein